MPQLWIVAGPNGAGKSTFFSRRLERRITMINPDVIAQALPRIDGRLDERRAGEIAIAQRDDLLARGTDFAIETTLTGTSALRLMDRARQAGYKVTLLYVGLASAKLSLNRVLDRVGRGGHAIPTAALERRYPTTMANLVRTVDIAHRVYIFDNSGRRRRLLAIRERGRTRYVTAHPPEWATNNLGDLLVRR